MKLKGDEKGTREVKVVILSGACCNPSLSGMDEQAGKIVEQAAAAAGVKVSVRKQPMVSALYGGVPRDVVDQLKRDNKAGGLRMPVVIIDGKGVSYGVPDAGRISAALRAFAGAESKVN